VRHDQRRPVKLRDDVRHRERLARARDAEEGLMSVPRSQRRHQRRNGLGLVAGGLVVGVEFEQGHNLLFWRTRVKKANETSDNNLAC
jgi:hypothetical protein